MYITSGEKKREKIINQSISQLLRLSQLNIIIIIITSLAK